jgi:hypothetical protein
MTTAYRVTAERITLNNLDVDIALTTFSSEYFYDLKAASESLHKILQVKENNFPNASFSFDHIQSDVNASGMFVEMSKPVTNVVVRVIIQQIQIQ